MERRTMTRIVGVVIALILLAGLACVGVVMYGKGSPFEGFRNSALNTLIDGSGIKGRIDGELREHVAAISNRTGIPQDILESGIDMLAIPEWEATSLPDDVSEAATYDFEYDGETYSLTAYDDPSYVTIDVYGQEITFDVPESTERFTSLAPAIGQMDPQTLTLDDVLALI